MNNITENKQEDIREMSQDTDFELSVNDLDDVAGGCKHPHHTKQRRRVIVGYRLAWVRRPPFPFPIPTMVPIYRYV